MELILVRLPTINHVVKCAIFIPRVVSSNHDVVPSTLPQEHKPRPQVEVALRVESHLFFFFNEECIYRSTRETNSIVRKKAKHKDAILKY